MISDKNSEQPTFSNQYGDDAYRKTGRQGDEQYATQNNNQSDDLTKPVKETLEKGSKVVMQSTQDWFSYIKAHPLQSMLFGTVILLSLKGLLHSNH